MYVNLQIPVKTTSPSQIWKWAFLLLRLPTALHCIIIAGMPEQVGLQRTKTTIAILLAFQLLSGFFFSKVSFLSHVLRSIGECLMPRRTSSSLVWRASSDTSPPCPMATRFDFCFNFSTLSSMLILPTASSFTRRMLERPGESERRRTEGWSAMLWLARGLSLWTPSSTRSGSSQSIVR